MKVLHVIARMNVGGTATYLLNLVNGLEERGVANLLAVGSVPKNEREDLRIRTLNHVRIEVLSRSLNPILDLKAFLALRRVVKQFQPDIIHSHTFKAGLLARNLRLGIPNVHTFHGHHLYDPEFGWFSRLVLNFLEKRLAKKSSKLLTIGESVGQELLDKGIGQTKQYVSIPPGIEPLEIKDAERVRNGLNITKSDFVVVWLGRFTQVKRPDLVAEVAKKLPHLVFVMAGDGELRGIVSSGAPENLRLVGVQNAAEMWAIADLALLTSDSEGMPLSMIEAQMSGVPVVATDVGSVSEIVEDGVTGILSEVDADQITSKIVELVENSSKLEKMSKAAKARAGSLFTREVMVEKHLKVYREILDRVTK
jgi:glycosyltransferase involved in cell wall biosynthesis